MKNKTIAILLLATTISISGCGGCSKNEASTEPTEVVMETESIIETEEPTETEEVAVETEEPIDIYSDEVIGTLAMYDFFEGSTADEIRQFVKDHDDIQEILNTHDSEYIDSWIPEFKDFYGGTLYELNHPATNNNNTNSNKGNSSSTSNNTGNTAGSQSNTNSSSAGSNSSTSAEQGNTVETPPADSNEANMQGDGTFTFDDASNFGGQFIDPGDSWNIE